MTDSSRPPRQRAKLHELAKRKRARLFPEVVTASMAPRPDRHRSAEHLAFVRGLCCIVCRQDPPGDPHHLKFVQPRARSLKSGDQWTIPMCRRHHLAVEGAGDEEAWWIAQGIDPLPLATELWAISQAMVKAERKG